MIQRVQTLFLIAIVVLMVLYVLTPTWLNVPQSEGTVYRLYPLFLFHGPADDVASGNWIFWPYAVSGALGGLAALLAIIEIFSFKNRITQIKLGAINAFLLAGVVLSSAWFSSQGRIEWSLENPGEYSFGIYLPAAALICNFIANRFIRKDERLVRSMDRIR